MNQENTKKLVKNIILFIGRDYVKNTTSYCSNYRVDSANCIFVGAYKIYTEYLNWLPETMDPHAFVSSLSTEERNILAETVLGYQEAKEAPKVKR